MSHLNENILAHHGTHRTLPDAFRRMILIEQVLGNPGSLCFPVAPHTHRAVMEFVAADDDIDCSMQLDSCDLCTGKLLHVVDVMNVIVLNQREHTALAADNSVLLAVMNVAAAYDVMSDVLLKPSVILAAADSISLHLCRALHMTIGKIVIVVRILVLAKRNTCAAASVNLTVLNDPALGPVRSDHAVLECRGRSPGRSRLIDGKAAYRDVIDAVFLRHKALTAHSNLNILLIGVLPLEVGIDHSLVLFDILLGVPFIDRILRLPGRRIDRTLAAFLQCQSLIQHPVIQENLSGMLVDRPEIPVALYKGRVRIVFAEHTVVNAAHPHIALIRLPVLDFFGTGNLSCKRLGTLINNSCILASCMSRRYIFPVNAGCNQNRIAGFCQLCSFTDGAKRCLLTSVSVLRCTDIHINIHRFSFLL